jgi:hypothetical protein
MATTKRKRNSTRAKPNKRVKHIDSSSASEATPESPTYWEADSILDELVLRGVKTYQIQWKGTDPKTGQDWEPTWEPEANANALLVASWEQEKARLTASSQHLADGSERGRSEQRQSVRPTPRRIRNSRVIESSPESSTRTSSPSVPSTAARDSAIPVDQSSRATTPIGGPAPTARALSRVQIHRRGDSLDRDEYVRFSQLNSPQRDPTPDQTQDSDLESSQLFAARPRPYSSGIVQDTQSSTSEGSFIPITQRTEETEQQSTNTNESQEEEDITEDSVRLQNPDVGVDVFANGNLRDLLDIIRDAASRAISPARSIPETIADTTVADSQSQRQRAEIGTLELVQSSSQPVQVPTEDDEGVHIEHRDEQQAGTQRESGREDSVPVLQQAAQSEDRAGAPQPQDGASQDLVQPERQQEDESDTQEQTSAGVGESTSQAFVDIETVRNSPKIPATTHTNPSAQNNSTRSPSQDTVGGAGEVSQFHTSPRVGVCQSQASATEHSAPDEVAQFPFHSQHPIHDFRSPDQTSKQASTQKPSVTILQQPVDPSAAPVTQVLAEASAVNASAAFPKHPPQHQSAPGLLPQHQEHDDDLLSQFLEPEFTRDPSPVTEQPRESSHPVVTHASQRVTEGVVEHFSQPPRSTGQSTEGREQNAQVVPLETYLSTQEDTTENIRPTVEKEYDAHRASFESRHDSSQETPERPLRPIEHSSSPIPHPPSFSLGTQDSKLPPRPCTPAPLSSVSTMASGGVAEKVERQVKELMAKARAENPFTPKRRLNRPSTTPSVAAAAESPIASPAPANRLLRANEPAEGTRSPSAVPDRVPAAQVPTSLRTVALAPSSAPRAPSPQITTTDMASRSDAAEIEKTVNAEFSAPTEVPASAASAASEEMDVSDTDDEDTESLLNDDLQLAEQEYIVPLSIQGRQSDMYHQCISLKKDFLEQFLKDPRSVSPMSQIEEIFHHLWAVETHIDLVFAEADMDDLDKATSVTQDEHAAQFGIENSTKFRFLHTLFYHLRESEDSKHVVLLTERDDNALYKILETFCKTKYINFSMPTKSRQADPNDAEGSLLVTIIPGGASPIIRPPDLIVCLDGVQEATQIRKKNWARSPERDVVPVVHLVIPRTVGHIARYISPNLEPVERMHTTLASLAQVREDIGKAINEDTPRDTACAEQVANWLIEQAEEDEWAWPLPSIGSVKDVIEYQTQLSQNSTTTPAPERTKRLLDDGDLDPAKRMRFTPQPQTVISSSVTEEAEITRISDSMPGTAAGAGERSLEVRLADAEEAFRKEREARKAEEQRLREYGEMCDERQTKYENLERDYRLLLGNQQTTETKLETVMNNHLALTERLSTRTTQMNELNRQLNEQRATDSLSSNDQIAEITKLRSELAEAIEAKERAIRDAKTAEAREEYLKSSRIDAQDLAATATTKLKELEARMPKLEHAASGEATRRKSMHLEKVYEQQDKQIKNLKAELTIVKRTLQSKEEEVSRLKSTGRMGVGTRGTSTTPQPKIRSRAGSPILGGRVGSLRNG